LFYVVCLAAMITHVTGLAMQALAWINVDGIAGSVKRA